MNRGIQRIFSEVPHTYELVNHVLTWGLDVVWRRRAARIAVLAGGERWIDVCSGTGEMAVSLSRLNRNGRLICAADFSLPMLQKLAQKKESAQIRPLLSDIRRLPFAANTFDLITISFATRNININRNALLASFKEFHRLLKPGGQFINLETSQPSVEIIRKFYHFYIKLVVKPVGQLISGSKSGYAYLSHTIPRFYSAGKLRQILLEAGFREVGYQRLMLGAAAIHRSVK